MPDKNEILGRDIGTELLNVPMDSMVESMGLAISESQFALDNTSVKIAEMMSGSKEEDRVLFGGQKLSLLELGFTPTFYQFVDTIIEVKIAISMTSSSEEKETTQKTDTSESTETSGWWLWEQEESKTTNCATVNGSYSSKYQYSVEGSSLLRTKMVPVPPPAILEERVRNMIEARKAGQAKAG